jgi:isoquinoline 1-oxidoreductase subunit beta
VPLKDPKQYRIIGKATKRLDTPDKVNGRAEFGLDVRRTKKPSGAGFSLRGLDEEHAKSKPGGAKSNIPALSGPLQV